MFRCGRCRKVSAPHEKGVMLVLERKPVVDPLTRRTYSGVAREVRVHERCETREDLVARGLIRPAEVAESFRIVAAADRAVRIQ